MGIPHLADGPRSAALWEKYRLRSEEWVRHQVIQNRLASIEANDKQIDEKRRDAKRGQKALYFATAYVAGLVL